MTEVEEQALAAQVTGDGQLAAALGERGIGPGEPEDALVFDAGTSAPRAWEELEAVLLDAYRLSRRAIAADAPTVYVLDGAALYGHAPPLRAALASGLLGGARSLAAAGARGGVPAHVVTVTPESPAGAAADLVAWLLRCAPPTGQILHCNPTHVGRPAV